MNAADIDEMLSRHRRFHNGTQIERFIIAGAGITRFGMYRQALREIHSRWAGLRSEVLAMARIEIDILEIERKPAPFSETRTHRRRIKLIEKREALRERRLSFADAAEELCRFLLIARELDAEFRSIDAERREELELEFHVASIARDAALELETMGRPSANTLRIIGLLPSAPRGKLIDQIIHKPEMLMGWARCIEYDAPAPKIDPAFVDEIKRTITTSALAPLQLGDVKTPDAHFPLPRSARK